MSKPTIGLAMIMQNEEKHIPVSIAQFYHTVDDIVVVDGGSEDGSVEWAEKMGARVFHRPFDYHFADQKNFAIGQLETDWVYLHDPDERLEPTLLELLPYLASIDGQQFLMKARILPMGDEPFDCIGIPRKNFIDGIQTPVYPDYQYRFFTRYCRFEGAVHEKIVGFTNRTELDYSRPAGARPEAKAKGKGETIETERGRIETGVNIYDTSDIARFNILHFKSSSRQKEQDDLYRRLRGEE